MIFLFFSLFIYDVDFQAYKRYSVYINDLNLSVGNRGKWLFSELEGGIGLDYTSSGFDIGFSDLFIRAGANRYVRMFNVSLFPVLHRPGRCKEGEVRDFSIRQPGFGFGARLGTEILWFSIDSDFEYIEHLSNPSTEHFLFDSEIKFNPDTLTFALDFELERFVMIGQDPISSIYIKPKIILSRWRNFSLNFGFSFRISGKTDKTSDNIGLTELGVNAGYYGSPSWKICFGISSADFHRKTRKLFPFRIFLVDEEGNPASGLLSLADSGSFQIGDGEIKFDLLPGIYPLSVFSEDCLPIDTVIVLKEETDVLLQIHKKPDFNIVQGKVVDVVSGKPLYAEIFIENSINSETNSDPVTGVYRAYLTSGDYIIRVTSRGYYPSTSLIEVKPGKVSELNFELFPVKKEKK
ncbi:carboxypeptidase regulatory-like domain-containing protein [candidate division WOR-3 bacterium]|nr:carboxypeptidase regulatory-like domain-containing protein [candidate division WOR-3 bacterium]